MGTLATMRRCFCMLSAFALILVWPVGALATDVVPDEKTEELMDLSLEELLQIEVISASRKPQLLSTAPAAIFAITDEDIRRSGARTIPDVLRMVPGIQVAQVDSSSWAVTARGSNGVFANKLLVLVDGRTVYSPMFSGVYWDTTDTELQSIERIEVIRGPGATMWGSNAVNGVINIITKHARDTQGTDIDAVAGTERVEGKIAYGGQVNNIYYRTYAKWFERDGFIDDSGAGVPDDWDMLRGGLRVDWSDNDKNTLTISTEVYSGDIGEQQTITSPSPPYNTLVNVERDVKGGFLMLAWEHEISANSDFQIQTYYDHSDKQDISPNETRDTFDIDMQHRFKPLAKHDVVWGLGYRLSKDDTEGSFTFSLDPASRTQRIFSAFIQDEISLNGDDLFLTVGTKVEKNSFSTNNLEWEPNLRMSWHATEQQTLWGSVARAVRTPSRVEQNGTINGAVLPPGIPPDFYPAPAVITISGNPELETEEVTAFELGYRIRPSENWQADVSVFYNEYENVRIPSDPQAPVCQPGDIPLVLDPNCVFTAQYISLPVEMINGNDVDTYGLELNGTYRVMESWHLHGAYSYLHVDDDDTVVVASAGEDAPEHQFSLRSAWNIGDSTEFDLWLRYVDELELQNIGAYLTMDARLMWSPMDELELSVVGRNLLDDGHEEFIEEFGFNQLVEIPREVYLEMRVHF